MLKKNILLTLVLFLTSLMVNAQLKLYDASQFRLIGKASNETETRYERLPANLSKVSRGPVWALGKCTAGMAIRFSSNTTSIGVKWVLAEDAIMDHMALTGIKGLDLYTLVGDEWVFVNTARPKTNGKENSANLISGMKQEMREYLLNLPLYDGVTDVQIEVDESAIMQDAQSKLPLGDHPIVAYGTSILQGGCASRPGMAHTNILSRWLNREVINLGFSGNGQLDYEIAELMATVDASIFILDFMPNVEVNQIHEKMEKFYRIIRDKRPHTPILFVENPMFPPSTFDDNMREHIEKKNAALHLVYQKINKTDKNLKLISSAGMIGWDGEGTVDGIHFTDLGFIRYAEYLYPTLKTILVP